VKNLVCLRGELRSGLAVPVLAGVKTLPTETTRFAVARKLARRGFLAQVWPTSALVPSTLPKSGRRSFSESSTG
jgi:hypothetical protein